MDGQRPRRVTRRGGWRAFPRTIAVGAVSLSLATGATIALASASQADDVPFTNGSAVAQASIVKIGPGVGSLQLATTAGTSLAKVTNTVAEAQAQALDLGLVGSTLTQKACDGSPGALTPEELPQPLVVDNRKGDASATKDEVPVSAQLLGGGRKEASADGTPSSHASVINVASAIGGTVTLSGSRSDASTYIVPGEARVADATVSVDIDIAGVVQLHGAQWHAVHRTGSDPVQSGTFSVASTTAGGIPVPIDQLGPLQDALNTALALTGITISLPQVQHFTSPNDFIQVTPLEIKLDRTPIGKAVLGPALNASRAQREQLINQIMATACQLAGAALVGDIAVDIASGTGFVTIDIGGVSASSQAVTYTDPFGDQQPFTPPADVTPSVASGTGTSNVITTHTPGVAASTGTVVGGTNVSAASGPIEKICETISPAKRPACSKGMGVPLALLAVLLTAGFATLDWRHQHKLRAADATAEASA